MVAAVGRAADSTSRGPNQIQASKTRIPVEVDVMDHFQMMFFFSRCNNHQPNIDFLEVIQNTATSNTMTLKIHEIPTHADQISNVYQLSKEFDHKVANLKLKNHETVT